MTWDEFTHTLRREEVARHEHGLAGQTYRIRVPERPAGFKPLRTTCLLAQTKAHTDELRAINDPLINDRLET